MSKTIRKQKRKNKANLTFLKLRKAFNQSVGPGLAFSDDRKSMDWVKKFVRNSQSMIAKGDKEAKMIYEKYNKQAMPSYDLTDEQIEAIYKYIDQFERF